MFLLDNWKDTKGLQRQFVHAILKGNWKSTENTVDPTSMSKVSTLCGVKSPPSTTQPNDCTTDTSTEGSDDDATTQRRNVEEAVEGWDKPSPRNNSKKGKQEIYLSPTSTKYRFDSKKKTKKHLQPGRSPGYDITCCGKAFKCFEKQMAPNVAKKVKGFNEVKKEIKSMWSALDEKEKESYAPSKHDGESVVPASSHTTTTTSLPQCICRQHFRKGNQCTLTCALCQEVFHCLCVNFCNNLAAIKTVSYVCASCIEQNYVTFVRFVIYEGKTWPEIANITAAKKRNKVHNK